MSVRADSVIVRRLLLCAAASLALLAMTPVSVPAGLPPAPPQAMRAAVHGPEENGPRRFALIVVGLPGDEEHARLFQQTVRNWSDALMSIAGVSDERLFVAAGSQNAGGLSGATGEAVRDLIPEVAGQVRTDDALWVFFLGHGSYDGQHTWLHLAGPDLNEGDWADLFARISCREQVFWLTQSASGGFVRALSRPDRIVIAATAPTGEVNETRFPHVLQEVLESAGPEIDADGNGRLSVLEVFRATDAGVVKYFEENELAATEHAELDDNGDGKGSEADGPIEPGVKQTDPNAPRIDGTLAAKVFVTTTILPPKNPAAAANDNP